MTDTTLTAELAAEAARVGKTWGEQEVELWHDQDRGEMCEWTRGTYCGDMKHVPDDAREAYEDAIDDAAQAVWDEAVTSHSS